MNNGTRIKFLDGERKRRDIVAFLAVHGQASSAGVAKALETAVESIRAHLKILADEGTVERVKNGRVPLWILKEQEHV